MPVTILIVSVTHRDRRINDKAKHKLPANNLARLASTQFITGTIRSLELAHNNDKLGSKNNGVKWRLCVKSKQRKRIFFKAYKHNTMRRCIVTVASYERDWLSYTQE